MSFTVLCVTASPRGKASVSRSLALEVAASLCPPGGRLLHRDLAADSPPHWRAAEIEASFTSVLNRSPEQKAALALSNLLCGELLATDILIIGAPVWNFSIPSSLKAWIDHIVRPGLTFRYEGALAVGLLGNIKSVRIIESAGG